MKSSKKSDLLRRTFTNFIVNEIILAIITVLAFAIILFIVSELDFQWLYDLSPKIYMAGTNIFDSLFIVIFALWLILSIINLYKTLKKVFFYIDEITKSVDNLFNENSESILLPPELSEIESKFNQLKLKSEKERKIAEDSEKKKNDLIAYLAHDLKTPLTSIIGYLSIVDEIEDMPKISQKKYIKIALDKSYRLEELVNELFDIARFNSEEIVLQKEVLNLNLMMEQIIDDFYPILKELNKEIKLNTEDNMKLYADPDKLSRVFGNLVKNAISYSKEESDIRIDISKSGSSIVVEVANKGKQIPKEKLDRLFEKFYRADSSRISKTGGSGLGLAIAKDIVKLHNGTITAKSDENETVFRVELPIK